MPKYEVSALRSDTEQRFLVSLAAMQHFNTGNQILLSLGKPETSQDICSYHLLHTMQAFNILCASALGPSPRNPLQNFSGIFISVKKLY